jgi:hypothetical protein
VLKVAADRADKESKPVRANSGRAKENQMRMRHRAIGVAMIVAGSIGLAACSSSSTANPSSSTGSGAASPSAVLLRAVQSTEQQNSADIDMKVQANVAGRQVGLTGSGAVDLTNNAMQLTLNIHGLRSVMGLNSVSVISVDGTTYVSIPLISKILPGKTWISEPYTSSSATGTQITNASDMLRVLSAKGAVVTKTGSTTIGTTPVTAYDVTIPASVLRSRLSSVGISPSDAAAVQKIFHHAGLTFHVYVDLANRIRRLSLSIAVPASSSTPANHEAVVIDFTNYGTPVSITAPPASQVATLPQVMSLNDPT